MALIYTADISPSKLELVQVWAPTQPWFPAGADVELSNAGAYRVDDPDGEVGIETLLFSVGDGTEIQVPLTYRGAPLEGAEHHLITTMKHSVLGDRWVYDGAGDPVYIATTATTVLTGKAQAELLVAADAAGSVVRREPTALVTSSGRETSEVPVLSVTNIAVRHDGAVTLVEAGEIRLALARVISDDALTSFADAATLTGTWAGHDSRVPLVAVWRA